MHKSKERHHRRDLSKYVAVCWDCCNVSSIQVHRKRFVYSHLIYRARLVRLCNLHDAQLTHAYSIEFSLVCRSNRKRFSEQGTCSPTTFDGLEMIFCGVDCTEPPIISDDKKWHSNRRARFPVLDRVSCSVCSQDNKVMLSWFYEASQL